MQRKAFVLLSGGLDSTTCLYKAIYDYAPQDMAHGYGDPDIVKDMIENMIPETQRNPTYEGGVLIPWVEAVSIDYGQRHKKEMDYAKRTCDRLGISHTVLDVGKLLGGASVMLSADSLGSVEVPDISYSDIKGVSPTYVPFRNGLMLSALTAHAQKYVNAQIAERIEVSLQESDFQEIGQANEYFTGQAKDLCGIYFGAHSEDAQNWAYPDCTPEFIGAMANAIYIGSYMSIRLHTPLEWLTKGETVSMGTSLGVPYADTWSCYKGEALHCGTCPTCRARKEAFIQAGVKDPTEYAVA